MTQQTRVILRCPECGGTNVMIDEDTGEYVCRICGLVIKEDMLDQTPEWRAFTPEEQDSKRRAGPPVDYSYFDKGLSTYIDKSAQDASGRSIPSETKWRMWRLRKWDNRAKRHDSQSRNLVRAMNELQRLSDELNIPDSVQKTAAIYYRKALSNNLILGRSIAAFTAAALYAACRVSETPRSLDEIVKVSHKSRKEITRDYRLLVRKLGVKMPIHDPMNYLAKIAEKANIPIEAQKLAAKILVDAKEEKMITGKDPRGIAAAILYIASKLQGENVTQGEISKSANISEVTLRNRKKSLMKGLMKSQIIFRYGYLRKNNTL